MTLLNVPQEYVTSESDGKITYDFNLTIFTCDDKVRFDIDGLTTSWMGLDDGFIKRIQFDNLNRCFLQSHLAKEIEIRNLLDEAIKYLESEKYSKAIGCLDEVLYYDESYGEALLFKSHALFAQGHFIKALRYYKRTIKANDDLKDVEYHKLLLAKSSAERVEFPKIKRFIFTGDEFFSRGEFKKAVENYDKALANPSKFKSKILYKLLNKKATALFKLKEFEKSLECFKKSLDVQKSDYAVYMSGFCEFSLGLKLDESFIKPLRIAKSQMLLKALILNESKLHGDAIKCVDELLANHFIVDKIYFVALSCKISSMEALGMDAQDQKELFNKLF